MGENKANKSTPERESKSNDSVPYSKKRGAFPGAIKNDEKLVQYKPPCITPVENSDKSKTISMRSDSIHITNSMTFESALLSPKN